MSSSALTDRAGCAHYQCADTGQVTVRFPAGSEAEYCEYHAEHLKQMGDVEVVR